MADTEAIRIPVQIELLLQKYTRDTRSIIRESNMATDALAALQKQAKQVSAALNALKAGKIALDIDSSDLDKAKSDIKTLDGSTPNVEVTVDRSQIMRAEIQLNTLDNVSPNVTIHASDQDLQTAKRIIEDIDAAAPSVDINAVQTELVDAKQKVDDLDSEVATVKVDADTSGVEQALNDLKNLAKIEIGLTLAKGAFNVAQNVGGLPIIGSVQELDSALKGIQARTGEIIPGAKELIENVYSAGNWGASREEIAGVVTEITKLGSAQGDLEDAAVSAFQTAQTTGFELTEVLRTQDKMVRSGLVGSYREAANIIVTGFQGGADRAGDFLDTLNEYSIEFADIGITGPQALNLINQSLEQATFNTDKVGDAVKEFDLVLREAVATGEGTAFDALSKFGMVDEAEMVANGEMAASEFFTAFNNKLNLDLASGKIDVSQARQALVDVFGTPVEDLGVDIVRNLDFTGEAIISPTAAEDAANLLNDNLGAAFQNLGRVLEQSVLDKLEESGIKIDEVLQGATDKLYEIAGLISDGAGIPEALEIALEAPGLANTIKRFESFFGNVVIELLTGFANVAETFGQDVSGIRGTISGLAETQLAFDIQLADDGQGIQNAIGVAINRGVNAAEVGSALNAAIDDALSRGDFGLANALVQNLATSAPQLMAAVQVANPFKPLAEAQTIQIPITNIDMSLPQEEIQAQAFEQIIRFLQDTGHGASIPFLTPALIEFTETTVDLGDLEAKFDDAVSILWTRLGEAQRMGDLVAVDEITAQFAEIPGAFQKAIDSGDFVLAQGIAEHLATIPTAFDDALNEGNFVLAEAIAGVMGDSELLGVVADTRAEAGDLGETFQELSEEALDLRTAGIDPVGEGIKNLSVQTNAYSDDLQNLSTQTNAYGDDLRNTLAIAKVTWQDYVDFVNTLVINAPGGNPPAIGGDAPGPFAGGGHAQGWAVVGEQGPELAYFGGTGADILNNQTSAALMSLIQQVGAGGSTSMVYNNFYINTTQHNNSSASGYAGATRIANEVRGMF